MILLSDANVLIELEDVGAIDKLPLLGECEVLDVVLNECIHEDQPDIERHIHEAGIKVIETNLTLLSKALAIDSTRLSKEDKMILVYAGENDRMVLTGDKPLRHACKDSDIEYHGLIWIMERFVEKGVVETSEICTWIEKFKEMRRSLPSKEIDKLKDQYGC